MKKPGEKNVVIMCEGPQRTNERAKAMGNDDKKMTDMIYARNEAGLKAASQSYGKLCRRIAYGVLSSHEDAEECFNDALLAVWDSIPPQRPASLSAYICRITRNIALNRLKAANRERRGGGERPVPFSELDECLPDRADDTQDTAAVGAVIDRWLGRQTRTVRLLFVGRYFEGAELRSLAAMLGMSEAAAKSALHRARLSLRRELEKAEIPL